MRRPEDYIVDGIRYPSVTEVLRLGGFVDFSHVAPEVLEKARQRGEWIANYIDQIERGLVLEGESVPHHAEQIAAYYRWKEEHEVEVLDHERLLMDIGLGYGGRLDILALPHNGEMQGMLCLVDVKASYDIPKTAGMQVAGYEQLRRKLSYLQEEGPTVDEEGPEIRPDATCDAHVCALHLKPNGKTKRGYQLKPYDYEHELEYFNAALKVVQRRLAWKLAEI